MGSVLAILAGCIAAGHGLRYPSLSEPIRSPAMRRIGTKNVRDKPAPGDGCRVLVMRLWPRGIKKSAVHLWLKELGTPPPLIRAWKSGRLRWPELRRGYEKHLRTPGAQAALRELARRARREPVTLLCQCPDPARCHRSVLQQVLRQLARR